MPEIEIVEAVEVFSGEPGRTGKKDTWVTYKVDGTRVYMITLHSEEANEVKILEAIKKAEAERAKLVGKKFTV